MSEHETKKSASGNTIAAPSKRRFLKNLAGASLLAVATPRIVQAGFGRFPGYRSLAFENTNTGDSLKLTYFENGRYLKGALHEINYILRDYHTGDIHAIDPVLLDQLHDLRLLLGVRQSIPIQIVSGYRSPLTNARLRQQSRKVAKDSLHMQGRAIDIRIPGVSTKDIRNAALGMAAGGVGYYPRSNFVHLDTGDFRTW